MKKILVFGGIIMSIAGLFLLSLYNFSQKNNAMDYKEIINKLVDPDDLAWERSWEEMVFEWNYSKGENMVVAIWPYYDWAIPSLSDEPTGMYLPPNSTQYFYDVKRLRVNVTNIETEKSTVIEIYYPYNPLKPGIPSIFQDYFGVPHDTRALSLNEIYPKAGVIDGKGVVYLGKVENDGIYRVEFSMEPPDVMDEKIVGYNKTKPWPHPVSPPPRVRLYKCWEVIIYPYRSPLLLLIGPLVVAIGVVVIFKGCQPRKSRLNKSSKAFKFECKRKENGD
ncbi:MAG: hypothetical protein QXR45_08945 [Candidatus Bathyarchaeia archaeon]